MKSSFCESSALVVAPLKRRLISFDVGIKNLAYCIFSIDNHSSSWQIDNWVCVNLLENANSQNTPTFLPCCYVAKSKTTAKKKKTGLSATPASTPPTICGKQSKWISPDANTFCNKHATGFELPKKEYTAAYLKKLSAEEIKRLYATTVSATASPPHKKADYIQCLLQHYQSICFRPIEISKQKTAKETDLISIGKCIRDKLDADSLLDPATITHVIIENQISTIASRMKTIQGMIAQYFILRCGDKTHIEFVSSHNKLKNANKVDTDDAETTKECGECERGENAHSNKPPSYKSNKQNGVRICETAFNMYPNEMSKWNKAFIESKKRDDLADCFLQGIWYLGAKMGKMINV